jgi:hypothetical protein
VTGTARRRANTGDMRSDCALRFMCRRTRAHSPAAAYDPTEPGVDAPWNDAGVAAAEPPPTDLDADPAIGVTTIPFFPFEALALPADDDDGVVLRTALDAAALFLPLLLCAALQMEKRDGGADSNQLRDTAPTTAACRDGEGGEERGGDGGHTHARAHTHTHTHAERGRTALKIQLL